MTDAWQRMGKGDLLKRPVPADAASLAFAGGGIGEDRASPLMVQECDSFVQGLEPLRCFHHAEGSADGRTVFPWIEALEAGWEDVAAELKSVTGDKVKVC